LKIKAIIQMSAMKVMRIMRSRMMMWRKMMRVDEDDSRTDGQYPGGQYPYGQYLTSSNAAKNQVNRNQRRKPS
jgi:hypothetical protein